MRIIRTLIKKEVRDILRDKKTLVIMVAVPLLLYPAMIMGIALLMSNIAGSQAGQVYTIAYPKEDEALLLDLLALYEEEKEEELSLAFIPVDAKTEYTGNEAFSGWLDIHPQEMALLFSVEYHSANQDSGNAQRELKKLAEHCRNQLLTENLKKEGLTEEFLYPIVYEARDTATASESMGISLGGSLGMLLITTIMLGAFYPVIDVTTGEKERGTLETLLTLPVTNFQMILCKFIAVSLFACTAALLSLLSLGGSVAFLVGSLAETAGGELIGKGSDFFIRCLPLLLLVVLVTALLLTAISMCFCIFAKSFKEANNYFTPFMLLIMLASMAPMLPSVELNYKTALIPIVNVSLLIRQVMAQQLDLPLAGMTIGVNLGFSILVIWLLSRIYNSENVLFRDGFQSFSLFEKRSEIKKGTIPKTGDLILAVTVLLLSLLYLGTAAAARSLLAGTLVNQLLILAIPLFLAWYMKAEKRSLFTLTAPSVKGILGGIFLYIGAFSLSLFAGFFLSQLFVKSTQNLNQGFGRLMEAPFPLLLLILALMPAIGEELFFRGLLLGSWRQHYGVACGVLLSSLVFGAFHLSLVKLIPTAILGACFAWICCRSGSIYVSMALHFINNFLSLLAMKYPQEMEQLLPLMTKTTLTTADGLLLLTVGCIFGGSGILLLRETKQSKAIP